MDFKAKAKELSDDLVGANCSVASLLEKFGQECFQAGRKEAFSRAIQCCSKRFDSHIPWEAIVIKEEIEALAGNVKS